MDLFPFFVRRSINIDVPVVLHKKANGHRIRAAIAIEQLRARVSVEFNFRSSLQFICSIPPRKWKVRLGREEKKEKGKGSPKNSQLILFLLHCVDSSLTQSVIHGDKQFQTPLTVCCTPPLAFCADTCKGLLVVSHYKHKQQRKQRLDQHQARSFWHCQ